MNDIVNNNGEAFEIEPWARQANEPWTAFQVFCKYRDLRPTERGMSGLAALTGKSEATLYNWAKKWNWKERVALYLDFKDRCYRNTQEVLIKDMRDRHARIGEKMLAMAERRIDEIDPTLLSPNDIVKFIESGSKLEQKARGDATESIKIKHEGNVNLNHSQSQVAQNILSDEEASRKVLEHIERATFGDIQQIEAKVIENHVRAKQESAE